MYGAEYLQTNHPYRSVNVPVAQFTAEGGFHYNFLSDVKKTVFLYAGASGLAGYETASSMAAPPRWTWSCIWRTSSH